MYFFYNWNRKYFLKYINLKFETSAISYWLHVAALKDVEKQQSGRRRYHLCRVDKTWKRCTMGKDLFPYPGSLGSETTDDWNNGIICPLFNCANYLGITLLPIVCKIFIIFSNIILRRLSPYTEVIINPVSEATDRRQARYAVCVRSCGEDVVAWSLYIYQLFVDFKQSTTALDSHGRAWHTSREYIVLYGCEAWTFT